MKKELLVEFSRIISSHSSDQVIYSSLLPCFSKTLISVQNNLVSSPKEHTLEMNIKITHVTITKLSCILTS